MAHRPTLSRPPDVQILHEILEPAFTDPAVLAALADGSWATGTNGAAQPAFDELALLIEELEARGEVAEAPPPLGRREVATPPPPPPALPEDVVDLLEADALIEVEDDELGGASEVQLEPPSMMAEPPPLERGKRRRITTTMLDRRAATLLYEDVIWLLGINDGEGALISLERLLVIANMVGDLKEFIDLNEVKLINLYEGYMGPFDKVVKRSPPHQGPGQIPTAYTGNEKIANLLNLVDGAASIAKIVGVSPYSALETCCILNQLRRAGLVTI